MQYPRPRFGTPYVFPISTILKSDTPTRELFIAKHLPNVMEDIAQEMLGWSDMSVEDGVNKILLLFGFKMKFLWTEVLIDAAYQYPDKISLFKRFPVGPGAAPTLSRMSPAKDQTETAYRLGQLNISSGLSYKGRPIVLSAENWEGIACEFRKYTNPQSGGGRKRRYQSS